MLILSFADVSSPSKSATTQSEDEEVNDTVETEDEEVVAKSFTTYRTTLQSDSEEEGEKEEDSEADSSKESYIDETVAYPSPVSIEDSSLPTGQHVGNEGSEAEEEESDEEEDTSGASMLISSSADVLSPSKSATTQSEDEETEDEEVVAKSFTTYRTTLQSDSEEEEKEEDSGTDVDETVAYPSLVSVEDSSLPTGQNVGNNGSDTLNMKSSLSSAQTGPHLAVQAESSSENESDNSLADSADAHERSVSHLSPTGDETPTSPVIESSGKQDNCSLTSNNCALKTPPQDDTSSVVLCPSDLKHSPPVILLDSVPKPQPKLSSVKHHSPCLLYTSPSPRDATLSRMPSSA